MQRRFFVVLLLAVCGVNAHAQAVVDGFSLDQISFAAVYSGNVPCSEYGQAGFAVRQFPGVVEYVQVVAQLAGSTTPPAWIVRNVPAIAGKITESAAVNLALLGVQRGTCIAGTKITYTVAVADHMITAAPNYTGSLAAFVGQRTNNAEGLLLPGPISPGVLPPPTMSKASPDLRRLADPAAPGLSGDVNAVIINRDGMANVPQGPNECAPAAVGNSMHWLESEGKINLNGESQADTHTKLKQDLHTSATTGSSPSDIVAGKLAFAQRSEHPLDLNVHYQANQITGLGASATSGNLTANRDGSGGPPTFAYIYQEMAKKQDVEVLIEFYSVNPDRTITARGGHAVVVSGIDPTPGSEGIWFNDARQQDGTAESLRTDEFASASTNGSTLLLQINGSYPSFVLGVIAESPKPVTFMYVPAENGNFVYGYLITPPASTTPGSKSPSLRAAVSGGLTPISGSPFAAGTQAVASASALGKFLYVANYGSNNLSAFKIDQSTGALTPITGSPFAVGGGPFSVTVDPSGRLLYVGNSSSSNVSAFTIDPITGSLAAVAGSPFPTGSTPAGVAVSPSGRLLFVANGNGVSVYIIDPATGFLTAVPGSPFAAGSFSNSVAVDPYGKYAYVVDPAFGAASGSIYAYSIGSTGALTPVAGSPFTAGAQPVYIVVDSKGQFAYACNYISNNVSAFTINSATGALTPVPGSPYAVGAGPFAVATDSNSQFVYVTSQGTNPGSISGFTIEPTSGALTPMAGSPFNGGAGPARLILADVGPSAGPAYPVPSVRQLAPSAATIGGSPFMLTVYGSNFVPGSVVRWNGASGATSFVSTTRLDVAVPAANLAAAGTALVTVVNPSPGGGTSNSLNFTVAASVTLPSVPAIGTVNDAGFTAGMAVAPGSIAASFGSALAAGNTVFNTLPPVTLGGSSVLFNGTTAAPLYYTSAGQINMQIPWEVAGMRRAFATFTAAGGTSTPTTVSIAPFAPGVFTLNAAGQGATVINTGEVAAPSGSIPGLATRPAIAGDYLTIYCTGLGTVTNQPATGAAAPLKPLSETITAPTVTIGGVPAKVTFSGLTPTYVGLYQVNVQVLAGVPSGSAVPLILSIGGQHSNTTTIAVDISPAAGQVAEAVSVQPLAPLI
jgi:6-phosphogluconolactonase